MYKRQTYSPTPGYENSENGYKLFGDSEFSKKDTLVISHAMSKNQKYIKQNGGKFYDWVEIKNISDKTVNLKDYYLSDDAGEPLMWQMPDKALSPNEHYLVIAYGSEIL